MPQAGLRSASHAPADPFADPADGALSLMDRLVALGGAHDTAAGFPAESVALLHRAGLLHLYAPPASGGHAFASTTDMHRHMLDVLRRVGRADLSLGRLYEGHVNAMLLFRWLGNDLQLRRLAASLDAGRLFGIWASEPAPGVTIGADGILTGAKHFASGAGRIGHALVTARQPDGRTQLVLVPADQAARADISGWTVRGMRATASGRYDLAGFRVREGDRLGAPDAYFVEPRFTAGAWRFLAVQLGGIEGLLAAYRAGLSAERRAEAIQRARFADALAATRTAYLWVREAALRAAGDDADAGPFVLLARGVVERAALDVMEAAARALGTRSAFDGERVDRITRDLSLYLRQAAPDTARDAAAQAWLDHDAWGEGDALW